MAPRNGGGGGDEALRDGGGLRGCVVVRQEGDENLAGDEWDERRRSVTVGVAVVGIVPAKGHRLAGDANNCLGDSGHRGGPLLIVGNNNRGILLRT